MKSRQLFGGVMLAAALAVAAGGGTARAADSSCPDSNPPNELVLAGGSPQSAQLGQQFGAPLQVRLANSNGCPLTGNLAGISVEFSAPGSGPSGIFAGSGSNAVIVGTDGQGIATAPTFTANDAAGRYTVETRSSYGSAVLYLSNTANGLPAAITTAAGSRQRATVYSRYAHPLQARVSDANGNPVQGAIVSFAIGTGPTDATASFLGGAAQASEATDSNGIATSPPLQAATTAGSFTATASVDRTSDAATFTLRANAARPAAINAGAASGESTLTRTRFRVPLAVTVTDRYGNPVVHAVVVFSAPRHGATGAFKKRHHVSRVVRMKTNANGIAVAPPFTANQIGGGYIVRASVEGAHNPASFALVNNRR